MRCLFFAAMQDSSEYRFADDGVSCFFLNTWNWKFQNRIKCLYFGGFSKLRVVVVFVGNMELLIVNNFFFISRVYYTNNNYTICPSNINYSGGNMRMGEYTPIIPTPPAYSTSASAKIVFEWENVDPLK